MWNNMHEFFTMEKDQTLDRIHFSPSRKAHGPRRLPLRRIYASLMRRLGLSLVRSGEKILAAGTPRREAS